MRFGRQIGRVIASGASSGPALTLLVLLCAPPAWAGTQGGQVDFEAEIRPIFERHCYECHGPGKREGGIRLSGAATAFEPGDSGLPAIEPGASELSLLVDLIESDDPDERMPRHRDPLAAEEVDRIRRWIDQGAVWPEDAAAWGPHWAYQRVERPAVPDGGEGWARNEVDRFVWARMEGAGLRPSPEVSRATLLRRVSLDLTGLPPTPEEVIGFLTDDRPDAYARVVDRLLASPHFGERWALPWLDLARYANSTGYQPDRLQPNWLYRDWVIDAINRDLGFDRFTIEQLAGDLLEGSTNAQKVATGFHRLAPLNLEAGIHPEMSRVAQVVDRVNVTATTWLGSTVECAQCHDHKYDPFSQREYYQLFAFFNSTEIESRQLGLSFGLGGTYLPAQLDEELSQVVKAASERLQQALIGLKQLVRGPATGFEAWADMARGWARQEDPWRVLSPEEVISEHGEATVLLPDRSILLSEPVGPDTTWYEVHLRLPRGPLLAVEIAPLPHRSLLGRGPGRGGGKNPVFEVSEVSASLVWEEGEDPLTFSHAEASGPGKLFAAGAIDGDPQTGWPRVRIPPRDRVRLRLHLDEAVVTGERILKLVIHQNAGFGKTLGRFLLRAYFGDADMAWVMPETRAALAGDGLLASNEELRRQYTQQVLGRDLVQQVRENLGVLADTKLATTPVMREVEGGRTTHVLARGSHLFPEEEVSPATPSALHDFKPEWSRDRLGLGRWLASKENPLTSRVVVNRWWGEIFGRALVSTPEDFGRRGAAPTHPKLLDWLAAEFMDNGWSRKHVLRTLVTSATYRQSSRLNEEGSGRDPTNRYLARMRRLRLSAEAIRDNALAMGGLLSTRVGGEPSYPPQPQGLWRTIGDFQPIYRTSVGEERYRRGVYVVRRRTTPGPSFHNFDAPDRASCVVQRGRTNTPLQALTLLNDPVFVEAAFGLAREITRDSPEVGFRDKLDLLFLRVLGRGPSPQEVEILQALYQRTRARLARAPARLQSLLLPFRPMVPDGVEENRFGAWFQVASTMMNLDEAITRP